MRILILGDSLPFPRPLRGQPIAATWPAILKERLPHADIWLRANPRSCMLDVLRELDFFTDSLGAFDLIVVQAGIVDCAPRPYPRLLYKMLEAAVGMPRLRRIERFAHRRLLWAYGRPWVGPRAFGEAVARLADIAHRANPRSEVIFLSIAPPTRTIAADLRGIDRAAAAYNEVLRREVGRLRETRPCRFVDPFAETDPFRTTIEDGHHLSRLGHHLVADAIVSSIEAPVIGLQALAS
jgi:lysophospholipase L1-like esterase